MLQVAVAQINSCVGDLQGNVRLIAAAVQAAKAQGAHLVLTPELALTGYPAEDLLLRPAFLQACDEALKTLIDLLRESPEIAVVVGLPRRRGQHTFNAAVVIRYGKIIATYGKLELPNYAVFDEQRYFSPDGAPCVFELEGVRVGLNICEDVWASRAPAMARASGAQVLLALNASPFHLEKQQERIDISRRNISRLGMPFIFCNLVGGQDELVFDGGSFVLDGQGALVAQAKMFQEDLLMVAVDDRLASGRLAPSLSYEEQAYQALVLGTRDYVQKNGFSGAVLGLSGGVDSALVLAIAVDALGPDKVRAVMMPSPYTLAISIEDAAACAKALGVQLSSLPIEPLMSGFAATLSPALGGLPQGLTEENLQARIRGNLLMAISNQTGALLLATGNKSEIAVGYCTLYGDMSGGFAVIKDLVKGMVYRLCRLRNQQSQVIPDRILSRAPSAELKHDQTDQDSLPPYDALDDMLVRFVEQGQSRRDLVAAGHAEADVDRVLRMIRLSEYKRRQAAPGVRISPRAFGRDWRYPLTNRFVEQSYNLEEGGKT